MTAGHRVTRAVGDEMNFYFFFERKLNDKRDQLQKGENDENLFFELISFAC
jgi:hypothetical protein